jgi:hypothetical protein
MAYVLADPSSKLNFSHDWVTDGWLAVGDTIASRLWTITPLNNTTPETPVLTGATTDVVFVQGLMAGKIYHLVERVTTAAGVIDDRTIVIRCENI